MMSLSFLLFIALSQLPFFCSSLQYSRATNCSGVINTNEIYYSGIGYPIQAVTNGKKFIVRYRDTNVIVVSVKGSPYEIGYASGRLLKEEIHALKNSFSELMILEVKTRLPFLPDFLVYIIAYVLSVAFDMYTYIIYFLSLPNIPRRFIDEMDGISRGAELNYLEVAKLNMQMETGYIVYCTLLSAWGNATTNGSQLFLRTIDLYVQAKVGMYPLITIYRFTNDNSDAFINLGFPGIVGTLTAYSTAGITIGSKSWVSSTGKKIPYEFGGKPSQFALRDAVQYGKNLSHAISLLRNIPRTIPLIIHVGSRAENSAVGIQYAYKIFNVLNDSSEDTPIHPKFPQIIYTDKNKQPSEFKCMGEQLKENYGKLDLKKLFQNIASLDETGDTQVVVLDLAKGLIGIAGSAPMKNIEAFRRDLVVLELDELLRK